MREEPEETDGQGIRGHEIGDRRAGERNGEYQRRNRGKRKQGLFLDETLAVSRNRR